MEPTSNVRRSIPSGPASRFIPGLGSEKDQLKPKPTPEQNKADKERQAKSAKLLTGVGLASAFALGYALKDGLNQGFKRIGGLTNTLSNIISAPFSLLFFPFIFNNERAERRGEAKSRDDLFNRTVYTAASLGFTPMTWGEPLIMGTRSKAHMFATILNLPHMLFSLFSYTGGRLLSFLKVLKMRGETDPIRKYRLEQEFEAFFTLGNLGSAQASVIPMSGQCILGWETVLDVFKGDFRSAFDRFKKEPVSVTLGTLFNSWMWPFEYFAKFFDTTIRTAEMVDNFRNAFKNPDRSWFVKKLEALRDGWHEKARNQEGLLGKCLKWGREASKIEALLIPPIGMISVVTPVLNRFLRGEFWNKEAQEIGGLIGFADKVFNIGAFISHIFYTGVYALNVRAPQAVTTATFYICNLINKMRGIEEKPNDKRYIEPNEIREKIFNWGPIRKISDWAAKRIDKLEADTHAVKERKLIGETGRCRHIRTFRQVIAKEVAYDVAKEEIYEEIVKQRMKDPFKQGGSPENPAIKEIGEKPSDGLWGQILIGTVQGYENTKDRLLNLAKEKLEKYLRESQLLSEDRTREFMAREYDSKCTTYQNTKSEKKVDEILSEMINNETDNCLGIKDPEITNSPERTKIQSKSFIEFISSPKDWIEALKLKTFHVTNTFLPLWIKGFVNVVDFGEKGEPLWLRNLKATESGIREGDVQQACNREFMPVVGFAFQSMGKGLAILWNLLHGKLPELASSE